MQNFQQQIEKYKLHEHITHLQRRPKDRQQSRFRHSQVYVYNNCIFGDVAIRRIERWEKKRILTNSSSTLHDSGGNLKLKQILWKPGHAGIKRNKKTDQEAKKAISSKRQANGGRCNTLH
jgi:ribonuclease HI